MVAIAPAKLDYVFCRVFRCLSMVLPVLTALPPRWPIFGADAPHTLRSQTTLRSPSCASHFGQRPHRLGLCAMRCSLFLASAPSPTRRECVTMLLTRRIRTPLFHTRDLFLLPPLSCGHPAPKGHRGIASSLGGRTARRFLKRACSSQAGTVSATGGRAQRQPRAQDGTPGRTSVPPEESRLAGGACLRFLCFHALFDSTLR